jgi:nucleoid-associated protein YgaU
LAQKEGYSPEQEAQLKSIWDQVVINDSKLMSELGAAREKAEEELARLAKVKSTLGRFRSGSVQESDWEKPV